MDQKIIRNRNTIRASILFYPKDHNVHESDPTIPKWLLNRYQDESYVLISTQAEKKDKHLRLWYRIIQKFGFISPESNLLLIWNLVNVVAIVFNFCEIPVAMFFTSAVYYTQFQSGLGLSLNAFFTTCLLLNLLIARPLTSYYISGKQITHSKQILSHYLKLQFWLNTIGWLSLVVYIFSNNPDFIYGKLLFYLYGLALWRMDGMVLWRIGVWRVWVTVYRLGRVLGMLVMGLFWIASVFFAIDYHYYQQKTDYYPTNLWLTNTEACQYTNLTYIDLIQTYPWWVWLNYSMYWALQTVTGVGYGDITPRNPVQVAYCDVVIVIFCLFYALFVNSVWQILVELLGDQRTYNSKILKYYQRNYNLDRQILAKLQNYLYETTSTKQKQQKEQQINETLSDELRNELLLARQKKLFIGLCFFNKLGEGLVDQYAEFLCGLAFLTREVRYGEGEVVFVVGGGGGQGQGGGDGGGGMAMLTLGEVRLSYPNTRLVRSVRSQDKMHFFGVADFLCRVPFNLEAKAEKYSKISHFNQHQFLTSIKSSPKISQKYQQLHQDLKLYQKHELSSQECWSCQSLSHPTHTCPQYFQWLTQYRNPIQIQKSRELRKTKISFRRFWERGYRKLGKVLGKKGGEREEKEEEDGEVGGEGGDGDKVGKLEDLVLKRNWNGVDQVRSYSGYRPACNI